MEAAFHTIKAAIVEGIRGKSASSRWNHVLSCYVVHNLRMTLLDNYLG